MYYKKIKTIDAIYYNFNGYNINKKCGMPNLDKSDEKVYNQEKEEMINKIVSYLNNCGKKINISNFNFDILNARYLTNGNLKLLEYLSNNGLTEEEIKDFILKTWPRCVIEQYLDRQKAITKTREKSSKHKGLKHKISYDKIISDSVIDYEKYFTIEQCKTIQELLDNKGLDNKYKMDIARLLLNTLKNIKCSNCLYCDEVPSYHHGTENKCELTKEKCPDSSLFNDRMINCPYSEYEKRAKTFIKK